MARLFSETVRCSESHSTGSVTIEGSVVLYTSVMLYIVVVDEVDRRLWRGSPRAANDRADISNARHRRICPCERSIYIYAMMSPPPRSSAINLFAQVTLVSRTLRPRFWTPAAQYIIDRGEIDFSTRWDTDWGDRRRIGSMEIRKSPWEATATRSRAAKRVSYFGELGGSCHGFGRRDLLSGLNRSDHAEREIQGYWSHAGTKILSEAPGS